MPERESVPGRVDAAVVRDSTRTGPVFHSKPCDTFRPRMRPNAGRIPAYTALVYRLTALVAPVWLAVTGPLPRAEPMLSGTDAENVIDRHSPRSGPCGAASFLRSRNR